MSELMNTARTGSGDFRPHLLASVSAAVLLVAVTAAPSVKASEDADRPTVWIELGGQLENVGGSDGRFISPIMLAEPQSAVLQSASPINAQRPPRYAVGEEGKLSFQPKNSDFIFSASVRYGRSTSDKHVHVQSAPDYLTFPKISFPHGYAQMYADVKSRHDESHLVLDFQVGKDVGLGLFGKDSIGAINAGVRIAQFGSHSKTSFSARPSIAFTTEKVTTLASVFGTKYKIYTSFSQHLLKGRADRSFHGIGPSLSWDTSIPLAGEQESAELTLDWGVNGAVLFGRQKATVVHNTTAYHNTRTQHVGVYHLIYEAGNSRNQSRSIIVPNVGGFAALTFKFPNSKVSFGYRGDFFFGAMDTGIDVANRTTVGFHGPYATISIGLGG